MWSYVEGNGVMNKEAGNLRKRETKAGQQVGGIRATNRSTIRGCVGDRRRGAGDPRPNTPHRNGRKPAGDGQGDGAAFPLGLWKN